MNADGTGQTNLTNNLVSDGAPEWSPDGSKIAFGTARDGNGEVYVMNADGSGATNLTNAAASSESYPAWSPDGTKIAFPSDRDGNNEVYVMNADGTGQTRLTNNPAEDYPSDWQPLLPATPTATATPTPTRTPGPPPPVGGISRDPEVAALPLETAGSSGPGAGVLTGIAAALAAGAVALGGAAWYTRRR